MIGVRIREVSVPRGSTVFATTIFSATQRCNVGTMLQPVETMLLRCSVALKIVVATFVTSPLSLYVMFSQFRPRDIFSRDFPFRPFYKLCIHVHVHGTTFVRNR